MATLLLTGLVAGATNAGLIGGIGASLLGLGASIGGQFIDSLLFGGGNQTTVTKGPRISSVQIASSAEGTPLPRLYGRMRLGGQLIWATHFNETEVTTTTSVGGGKGGGPSVTTVNTEYFYSCSFAYAFCEGTADGFLRLWADGKEIDLSDITFRFYRGNSTQNTDSLIESKEGATESHGYRDTCYIVFEDMPLERFGNRIPQIQAEVYRSLGTIGGTKTLEGDIDNVIVGPGDTEHGYGTTTLTQDTTDSGGNVISSDVENEHLGKGQSDFEETLEAIKRTYDNVGLVWLEYTWFVDDLRCANATVKPYVVSTSKNTSWTAAGLARSAADVTVAFNGTPSDISFIEAIRAAKAEGFQVGVICNLECEIPGSNTLPNPYSDNAATNGQDKNPLSSKITVSPARGFVGSVDGTATAATQIATFSGSVTMSDYTVTTDSVVYNGAASWTYSRFVTHTAGLCGAADGVDKLLIGKKLTTLVQSRDNTDTFNFVDDLVDLQDDTATIASGNPGASLASSDFPEVVTGITPQVVTFDGGNNYGIIDATSPVVHGLGNATTGTVGSFEEGSLVNGTLLIDYPISKFGLSNAGVDAGGATLAIQVTGTRVLGGVTLSCRLFGTPDDGMGAPDITDRTQIGTTASLTWNTAPQTRTINISASTIPTGTRWIRLQIGWVDGLDPIVIDSFDSAGGVTVDSSYLAAYNEYGGYFPSGFNVAAADLFFPLDPLWSNANNTAIGIDYCLPLSDWRDDDTSLDYQAIEAGTIPGDGSIYSLAYLESRADAGEYWDYFYADGNARRNETRTTITDPDSLSKEWIYRYKAIQDWSANSHIVRSGGVEGSATSYTANSKDVVLYISCPAIDKGSNQPDTTLDSRRTFGGSAPHFSSGSQDPIIQRQYIQAVLNYYTANGSNVKAPQMSVGYVAPQPWPVYPLLIDEVRGASEWSVSRSITNRLGLCNIADFMAEFCEEQGFTDYDFTQAYGHCDGYVLTDVSSFRQQFEPASLYFFFDLIDAGATIKAASHYALLNRATITSDQIVGKNDDGDVFLTRQQETELPIRTKIGFWDSDTDYDPRKVEAFRNTSDVGSRAISDSQFPIVTNTEMASQYADRLLFRAWAEREVGELTLIPSLITLEPGDVIKLNYRDFDQLVRIVSISDGFERTTTLKTIFRNTTGGVTSPKRQRRKKPTVVAGIPTLIFMDAPLLSEKDDPYEPYLAGSAVPWRGGIAVYRSKTTANFVLQSAVTSRVGIGLTNTVFNSGPHGRWDDGNTLEIEFYTGAIASATEAEVLDGANALAIETSPDNWEIIQFVNATLVSPNTYSISKLLRGQRGSNGQIEDSVAAGARVVKLTGALTQLDLDTSELNVAFNYLYGPVRDPNTSNKYVTVNKTFTGVGLRPYSPTAFKSIRNGSSGLDFTWIRRDRIGGDSWTYTTDIPLNEASEEYELEIYNLSGTVVRTVTGLSTPSYTYTSANITADGFTNNQSAFYVIVYQISAVYGRGTGARFNLNYPDPVPTWDSGIISWDSGDITWDTGLI